MLHFFFFYKLKVCGNPVSSKSTCIIYFQKHYFKIKYVDCFLRHSVTAHSRPQCSVNIMLYAVRNQVIWLTLGWYSHHCGGLELKLQYLWGLPVLSVSPQENGFFMSQEFLSFVHVYLCQLKTEVVSGIDNSTVICWTDKLMNMLENMLVLAFQNDSGWSLKNNLGKIKCRSRKTRGYFVGQFRLGWRCQKWERNQLIYKIF